MSLVSILIPVFNGEKYIAQCIDSIIGCVFSGKIEIIIVDDGSTDNTLSILQDYTSRYRYIKLISQKNKGIESALNTGIRRCDGELILRMDADDVMLPHRIATQVEFMRINPGVDWTAGRAMLIDWDSKELVETWSLPDENVIFDIIEHYNFIIHPTVAIRRDALLQVDGYKKGVVFKEDVDLWKRLIAAGFTFKAQNIPLIKYRIHNASVRAQGDRHAEKKLVRFLIYFGARRLVLRYLYLLPLKYRIKYLIMLCAPTSHWKKKALRSV